MTIRDQISKMLSSEIDVSDDGEILHIDDTADAICAAFPVLFINSSADFEPIATALRDGVRGDWDDMVAEAAEGNTEAKTWIAATKAAMEAAAAILHKEPDDPIQAYLKRMAERGDDEAKSLLA
mgnify:CR=1 FL=1